MKKQIMAIGVLGASLLVLAGKNTDPVLMNVAGKDVRLSEFEYLYHKNNAQQVQPQTLDEYVQMFVNYKLKVADAEAAGIDTTESFVSEFTKYRNELSEPYLRDEAVLDALVQQSYDHMANELTVSHIMMRDGNNALMDSLRTAIVDGSAKFEDVAREYSIDKPSAVNGGFMGSVVAGRFPWPFEEAAYATPVGQISQVVNSGFGLHIIRVESRKPARGEVLVEHILRLTRNMPDSLAAIEKVRIDSLYNEAVKSGADFGDLARRFSQDPGSAQRGGRLDWFGAGMMVAEFDSVSFALPVGETSKPFKTAFGWHIIHKVDARGVGTLEENRDKIINTFGRDERGDAPRRAFIQDCVKRYNASLLRDNIATLPAMIDQLGGQLDSLTIATLSQSSLPVFVVNGKKTPLSEVMPRLPKSAVKGGENCARLISDTAHDMMNEAVLEEARNDLAENNTDFRNLVNEYRDGILLFEISNRNVWEKASQDKAALEEYFKANRDKYTWEQPKFKSFIFFANNDSLVAEAVKYAGTLSSDITPSDLVQAMRKQFGKELKVERVIAAKGENAITDFLAFGGPKPESENNRWSCYAAFNGRVIGAPEEAVDVRGAVVADFQNELERQWLEQLHKKYKVKINKKVLGQVK